MPQIKPSATLSVRNICIGIAGPSASGKSNIARTIANQIGGRCFCLDDFFISGTRRHIVNGFPSFERPDQYDGAEMAVQVRDALKSGPVVAEGFLLFKYPETLALCDHKYFIAVPSSVIVSRRTGRRKIGSGKAPQVEQAFDAHGIQEWEEFGASQSTIPGVVVVNGNLPSGLVLWQFHDHCPEYGLVDRFLPGIYSHGARIGVVSAVYIGVPYIEWFAYPYLGCWVCGDARDRMGRDHRIFPNKCWEFVQTLDVKSTSRWSWLITLLLRGVCLSFASAVVIYNNIIALNDLRIPVRHGKLRKSRQILP